MDKIEEIPPLDKNSDYYRWLEFWQYYREVIVPAVCACNQGNL